MRAMKDVLLYPAAVYDDQSAGAARRAGDNTSRDRCANLCRDIRSFAPLCMANS